MKFYKGVQVNLKKTTTPYLDIITVNQLFETCVILLGDVSFPWRNMRGLVNRIIRSTRNQYINF